MKASKGCVVTLHELVAKQRSYIAPHHLLHKTLQHGSSIMQATWLAIVWSKNSYTPFDSMNFVQISTIQCLFTYGRQSSYVRCPHILIILNCIPYHNLYNLLQSIYPNMKCILFYNGYPLSQSIPPLTNVPPITVCIPYYNLCPLLQSVPSITMRIPFHKAYPLIQCVSHS